MARLSSTSSDGIIQSKGHYHKVSQDKKGTRTMVDYEEYETLVDRQYEEENVKRPKKMKRPPEDRNKGRKLNHRTKKNKAREF